MGEVHESDQYGRRQESRLEQVGDRAPLGPGACLAQHAHRWLTETHQSAIDPLQRPRRAAPVEKRHGFRHQQPHDGQEAARRPGTVEEHLVPGGGRQQSLHEHAADDSAQRISDHHQRHGEVAPAAIGNFRGGGIDRGQRAADAEAGEQPPQEQRGDTLGVTRPRHADGHGRETPEDGRASPHLVGHATEEERPERHAEQFHGENPAEGRLVDAPVARDAGGGEADRQDIEPVHGVQSEGDEHGDPLPDPHRAIVDDGFRVPARHAPPGPKQRKCYP